LSALFRATSRAFRAASRALAASTALSMILRAVFGFSSKNCPSFSLTMVSICLDVGIELAFV
jgi:hypothetical protein